MGPMGAGVRVGARSWRAMEDRLGAAGSGTVSPESNSLSTRQSGPPLQHCREQGPRLRAELLASRQGLKSVPISPSHLELHRAM